MSLSYILNVTTSTTPKAANVIESIATEAAYLPLAADASPPSPPTSKSADFVTSFWTPSHGLNDSDNSFNGHQDSHSPSESMPTRFIPDFSSDLLPYSLSYNSKSRRRGSNNSHNFSSGNSSRSRSSTVPPPEFEISIPTAASLSYLFPDTFYHARSEGQSSTMSRGRTESTTPEAIHFPPCRRENAFGYTLASSDTKSKYPGMNVKPLLPVLKHRALLPHPKMALSYVVNPTAPATLKEVAFEAQGASMAVSTPRSDSFALRSRPLPESMTLIPSSVAPPKTRSQLSNLHPDSYSALLPTSPSSPKPVAAPSILIRSPMPLQSRDSVAGAKVSAAPSPPPFLCHSTGSRVSPILPPHVPPPCNYNDLSVPPNPEPLSDISHIDTMSARDLRLDIAGGYISESPLASPVTTPPSSPPPITRVARTEIHNIVGPPEWAAPPPAGLSASDRLAYQRSGVHWMLAQIFGSGIE